MKIALVSLAVVATVFLFSGCAAWMVKAPLDSDDERIAKDLGIEARTLGILKHKPLYKMKPEQVDRYLAYLHARVPCLQERIVHLARKNIGQPYEIYLLGEFPYEIIDPQPLFQLKKSDCVVFSEHTYAMALSSNWTEFFRTLQRLRYKNGEIGVLTRNHYTVVDWDRNNRWMFEDVTRLVGEDSTVPLTQVVRRKDFFKKRYHLDTDIPDEPVTDEYIPREAILTRMDLLQAGDFVNVIRGNAESQYAGHTGLITKGPKGETYFLHSTPPRVREQLLSDYLEKTEGRTLGMKFLRPKYEELKDFNRPTAK